MEKEIIRKIGLLIILLIIIVYGNIIIHEQLHKTIYEQYNCTAKIKIEVFKGTTTALCPENTHTNLDLLQQQIEIADYIIKIITLLFFIYLTIKIIDNR